MSLFETIGSTIQQMVDDFINNEMDVYITIEIVLSLAYN